MAQRIEVSIEHKGAASADDGRKHPNTCPSCGLHHRDDELERNQPVCPPVDLVPILRRALGAPGAGELLR